MSISPERMKSAYDATLKFYEDVQDLVGSVLSKEQEEIVNRINKTDAKLKKYWENDFEKIRKEDLARHCFDLFECLNMMRVSILKAVDVENSIRTHLEESKALTQEEMLVMYHAYHDVSYDKKMN